MYAHDSAVSQTGSRTSDIHFFLHCEDLRFLGSLFHVQLHLLKTDKIINWGNMTEWQFEKTDTLISERDVSAHFYYVRCQGLQWDQSRLLHVDLLLIRNYPGKILRKEMPKCVTTHANEC